MDIKEIGAEYPDLLTIAFRARLGRRLAAIEIDLAKDCSLRENIIHIHPSSLGESRVTSVTGSSAR